MVLYSAHKVLKSYWRVQRLKKYFLLNDFLNVVFFFDKNDFLNVDLERKFRKTHADALSISC